MQINCYLEAYDCDPDIDILDHFHGDSNIQSILRTTALKTKEVFLHTDIEKIKSKEIKSIKRADRMSSKNHDSLILTS